MKFLRFDNPFLLAVEGFVAGAILFWSIGHEPTDRTADRAPVAAPASAVGAGER